MKIKIKIATPKKERNYTLYQFQNMIYGSINSTKIGSDLFDVEHTPTHDPTLKKGTSHKF